MSGELVACDLRCAHRVEPLAVEPDRVVFGWRLEGSGDRALQSAYQILVAASEEELARDIPSAWDSGVRRSSRTTGISYAGRELRSAERLFWKVRSWDRFDAAGPWSAPACFGVARSNGDWRAQWIKLGPDRGELDPPADSGPVDLVAWAMRPPPYFRREFVLAGPVRRATLAATALGIYALSLNGEPISDSVLDPGWTDYARRQPYQTFDVTRLLVPGPNVLDAVVADGWACSFYGFQGKHAGAHYAEEPELLAQLDVEYADGGELCVATDGEWTGANGPLRSADLLMGEHVDFADAPGAASALSPLVRAWRPVGTRALGATRLVADPGPPVIIGERLAPVQVTEKDERRFIVDFGQNIAGWVRVSVDEPAGTEIVVRHGEVLDDAGELYVLNLRSARAIDRYRVSGGRSVLEPRFTFHGFRYAEISGPAQLTADDVVACVVHSDIAPTGTFACSSAPVDRLFANIDWGQRGNFLSIPTDCPQRDERLGWMGDAQIFARTAAYNRDVAAFFGKWLDDVADAQRSSGAYTDFAPTLGLDWSGAPAWADAGVIVPWTMYKMYGDAPLLARHYAGMRAWMAYLENENPAHLREQGLGNCYGDWLAPRGDHTPPVLLATCYWHYDAVLMAEIAAVLGRDDDVQRFAATAAAIRADFARAFLDAQGEMICTTQTALALALQVGILPEHARGAAARALAHAVAREDDHLSTGFVGVGYLLPMLSAHGHSDVAYRLLEQRSYPSWLYTVERGATTIWERWDGWTETAGFQSPQMNSFNHYSLGSVGEWLYRFVLGIDQAPGSAGFEEVCIRPHPGGSLTFARGAYRSVRGEIAVSWERDAHRLELDVAVPANVVAAVHVPSSEPFAARRGSATPPDATGAFPGAAALGEAIFSVPPGRHHFSAPLRSEGETS